MKMVAKEDVIHNRIRCLIDKQGGIAKVSRDLGISANSISNWYNNGIAPKADSLKQICDTYNVSADYLLGRANESNATGNEIERIITEYTGISNRAVHTLHEMWSNLDKLSKQDEGCISESEEYVTGEDIPYIWFAIDEIMYRHPITLAFLGRMIEGATEEEKRQFISVAGHRLSAGKLAEATYQENFNTSIGTIKFLRKMQLQERIEDAKRKGKDIFGNGKIEKDEGWT